MRTRKAVLRSSWQESEISEAYRTRVGFMMWIPSNVPYEKREYTTPANMAGSSDYFIFLMSGTLHRSTSLCSPLFLDRAGISISIAYRALQPQDHGRNGLKTPVLSTD